MKKVLALVLAFAMIFSSISFVFADAEVGDDTAALATIGMLQGDGGGVTAEYEAKELNRLTAAILILRLRGLEDEALEYEGEDNFEDAEEVPWAAGRNVLAFLKDNPEIGFIGNEGNFDPLGAFTEQMLYKVLLENLGYKQNVDEEVEGDFDWDDVLEFAEGLGLEPERAEVFTVGGLARAMVAALQTNVKDGDLWLNVLIENEKVDLDDAIAAGLLPEVKAVGVAVDEVKAIGNTIVEIVFEDDVDGAAAGSIDNYEIEGLEIKEVVVTGSDTVRLVTAAQTSGKVYVLTVGEEKVKFTGRAKVSGGPKLEDAVSEDVEEVVLTFDKVLDYEAATDVSNYSIGKVEIVNAEVDGDEVTLTTEGLKNKQRYTVKVTNMKSVDGATRRSDSRSFSVRIDTAAPRIDSNKTEVQTNHRIVLYFNEKVTKETAEDIDNYVIAENKKDGDELEILSITWDSDDKDNVEIITEPQTHKTKYKLSVNNIADRRKEANVMVRPSTFTFTGLKEDTAAPKFHSAKAVSNTAILVEFKDDSKIDEESALNPSNYTFSKGSEDLVVEDVIKVKSKHQLFKGLVIVEGMEIGKKHTLKAVDIMDEFGNAITREMSKPITPKKTEIDSAMLEKLNDPYYPIVIDKNTIILKFTKELDEDSAENIDNYSINKDIGAPTKAEYDDDKLEVTLTVNELIQGLEYKITIDGVEDIAGNVLYFKDIKFSSKPENYGKKEAKTWDSDAPELLDVYAVNRYVVALEFDEELELLKASSGDYNVYMEYYVGEYNEETPPELEYLPAKALVEGKTVVEFSNFGTFALDADETYTVTRVVYALADTGYDAGAIKDKAGNTFMSTVEEGEDLFSFDGTDELPEIVYLEGYEQVNGKNFELTFSKDVAVAGSATKGWKIDSDDNYIVRIDVGVIKDGTDYPTANGYELYKELTDLHGIPVEDEEDVEYVKTANGVLADDEGAPKAGKTVLVGEYEDEDKPYVIGVTVIDRQTIEVEFNEHILSATGGFKLKNLDTDKNVSITIEPVDAFDEIVTISLSSANALEGRYEYELTVIEKKIKDYVGETADEDVLYFYGTDLAKQPKKD